MPRQLEKRVLKQLPEDGKSQWVKCWKCGAWLHCRSLTHHLYNTSHKWSKSRCEADDEGYDVSSWRAASKHDFI